MAFERLIKVARIVAHAVRMGLLVSVVALGSVALWLFVNRPDDGWAVALRDRLAGGAVPVASFAPSAWSVICAVPPGADPVAVLRTASGGSFQGCDGWKPWFRYYPGIAGLGAAGPDRCVAQPVPETVLAVADGAEPRCHDRYGQTVLEIEGARLAVRHR